MKIFKFLLSMPTMAILLLVFAVSIGLATFVEDIYGTVAAKAVIYNTKWFEFVLLWLAISLIYNIFKYKLYLKPKIPVFLFHISFVVIIIGAALTRYIGKDGIMHIREGSASNIVASTDTYFKLVFSDNTDFASHKELVRLTPISEKNLNSKVVFKDEKYRFNSAAYLYNVSPKIAPIDNGKKLIDIMISSGQSRQAFILEEGESISFNKTKIHFGNEDDADILINFEDSLTIAGINELVQFDMIQSKRDTLDKLITHPLQTKILYEYENLMIVVRDYNLSGRREFVQDHASVKNSFHTIKVDIESKDKLQSCYLPIYTGNTTIIRHINIDSGQLELSFGNDYFKTPFYVYLKDFNVTRYTGSNSPSSFDSHVQVLDNNQNYIRDYHKYKNHILNENGWRFYQNSYDDDELGTILSVTWDDWGIKITYLGYFLLSLGMLLALFWKGSMFRFNLKKLYNFKHTSILLILLFSGIGNTAFGQNDSIRQDQKEEIIEKLNHLWVADKGGRIKPANTLFYELSRKLSGKNSLDKVPAHIAVPSMMFNPEEWGARPFIKVGNDLLKDTLGVDGKYATIRHFFSNSSGFSYILRPMVNTAYKKAPHDRNKFDNEVIAVDERINVFLMIQNYDFLRVFPDPADSERTWYSPSSDLSEMDTMDSLFVASAIDLLVNAVQTNSYENANMLIDGIHKYQQRYAADLVPSESHGNLEILYERTSVFSKLSIAFVMIALLILLLVVISMFSFEKSIHKVLAGFHYLLWLLFILQFSAMAIRWYITGHAPLSNGYEAMLYVSLAGLLVGLIMSYKNRILLFVSSIFAAAPLFVAHLSLMNPELTNLVPVLKSYWLTIHVATITASYAVLGFAAVVALVNLLLMAYSSPRVRARFDNVINEFTYLNEILLTIGLYLLTIGCFLGGIWANESWGTYWSWDPKETWALVAILVYAFVAHIKHIESLRSRFAFNLGMFLSYATILMTYFGVNYFLGGMHSYGKGDAFNLGAGTYLTLLFILVSLILAQYKESKLK